MDIIHPCGYQQNILVVWRGNRSAGIVVSDNGKPENIVQGFRKNLEMGFNQPDCLADILLGCVADVVGIHFLVLSDNDLGFIHDV